jgi:hypothetical protein
MRISKTSGCPTNLPGCRRILTHWIKVARRYRARTPGDVIWEYHERANTGFLAAAVWLAGGVALEEWRTEKKSDLGPKRQGRGDLWVRCGRLILHAEAKHQWVELGSRRKAGVALVKSKLAEASRDACDIQGHFGEKRVGVLFAAPWMRHVTGRKRSLPASSYCSPGPTVMPNHRIRAPAHRDVLSRTGFRPQRGGDGEWKRLDDWLAA